MEIKEVKFKLDPEDEGLSEDELNKKKIDAIKALGIIPKELTPKSLEECYKDLGKGLTEAFEKLFKSIGKRERIIELEKLIGEMKSNGYNIPDSLNEELGDLRSRIRLEDQFRDRESPEDD
jgi:hypothetical protein